MKNIGIIAEYNPFHNGHLYQIEKVKKDLNPDSITIVLSQDIVQRGSFASFDKWWRAQKALEAGVDLVIGLPYFVSSQSAETFANGSVKLLNNLGINTLVFGSEYENLDLLNQASELLVNKESEIIDKTKKFVKEGISFPKAREKALLLHGNFDSKLFQPNNILALEYLKSIKKNNYLINPYLIKREGNNYQDLNLNGNLVSAGALRKGLLENLEIKNNQIPYSLSELKSNFNSFNEEDLFSSIIITLLNSTYDDLINVVGINNDRANQLLKLRNQVTNYHELIENLKSKNITRTAINRLIINILMNYQKEDAYLFNSDDFQSYARVLGFNQNGRKLLKKTTIPTISTFKTDSKKLNPSQMNSLSYDLKASRLRSIFLNLKEYNNKDYFKKPIILE